VLGASARELAGLGPDAPLEVRAETPAGATRALLIPVPLDDEGDIALALVLHLWTGEGERKTAPEGAAGITSREREVLALLASGRGTQAIAQDLGIARTTARNHIQAILGKLEAHSRLEAVARARDLGLV
jgi:DNA-binding CsgD family transcriptional regulator